MDELHYFNIEYITKQLIIVVSWIVILLVLLSLIYCFWGGLNKKSEDFRWTNVIKHIAAFVFLLAPSLFVSLNILIETYLLFIMIYKTSVMYN
jgi:hypothetical protein